MVFYEIPKKLTNQSQGELIQVLSTSVLLILFGFRNSLQLLKIMGVPQKFLFIWTVSINSYYIRNKKDLTMYPSI